MRPIQRIVVMGDSLSDQGLMGSYAMDIAAETGPYRRFSDKFAWTDYCAAWWLGYNDPEEIPEHGDAMQRGASRALGNITSAMEHFVFNDAKKVITFPQNPIHQPSSLDWVPTWYRPEWYTEEGHDLICQTRSMLPGPFTWVNSAIGGSTGADTTMVARSGTVSCCSQQLKALQSAHLTTESQLTLLICWFGANDLLTFYEDPSLIRLGSDIQAMLRSYLSAIKSAINTIHPVATFIIGMPNYSTATRRGRLADDTVRTETVNRTEVWNARLRRAIPESGISTDGRTQLRYIDSTQILDTLQLEVGNIISWGRKAKDIDPTHRPRPIQLVGGFDEVHPSDVVYRLIAVRIINEICNFIRGT